MEAADVARASLLGRHEVIDGLALLQPLLHLDEQLHAVHHHLHQLHLREAQAVRIGDVKDPTHGGRVHTAWRDSQFSGAASGATPEGVLPPGTPYSCASLLKPWRLSTSENFSCRPGGAAVCTPARSPVPRLDGQVRM